MQSFVRLGRWICYLPGIELTRIVTDLFPTNLINISINRLLYILIQHLAPIIDDN
jgi:hypothetical protein